MDMMQLRRRLLAQNATIPPEYRRVDWLRSSGTEYIDTGYYFKTNSTVDITFRYEGTSSDDRNPFGTRIDPTYKYDDISIWVNTASSKGVAVHYPIKPNTYSTDTGWIYHKNPTRNIIHLLITPQYIYANNTLCYTFNENRTQFTLPYSAWMFGSRAGESGQLRPFDAFTIYSLSLSEGTTLHRNFVPCVRLSDSKPGMYDTVNDVFYTNSGTGEFSIPS